MHDIFELVGTTVRQQYRVDALVGQGGFGVVYRGFHVAFERPVALKLLKVPHHFTDEARRVLEDRFREEARVLAKLAHHPAIVQVLDVGTVATRLGEVPYLVLEWLAGADLEQEILAHRSAGAPPLSPREAAKLLAPAIDALALAHRMGVAHRDIKPANLFLCDTVLGPTTKVLDFGIAKAMQAGDTASRAFTNVQSAFRAFTPTYGAPEQVLPTRYGASGPWTDVHALGLILTELVTGRQPIPDDDLTAALQAAINPVRPTPRALGAPVSDELEAVLARALALEPKDRFPNAGALHQALAPILERSEGRASAPSIPATLVLRSAAPAPPPGAPAPPAAPGFPPTLVLTVGQHVPPSPLASPTEHTPAPPRFEGTIALDGSELQAIVPSERVEDPPAPTEDDHIAAIEGALPRVAPPGFRAHRVSARVWKLALEPRGRVTRSYEIRLADGIVTVLHGNTHAGEFSIRQLLKTGTSIELSDLALLGFTLEEALKAVIAAQPPDTYGLD